MTEQNNIPPEASPTAANTSANNKRIAKNTMMLYFRMILSILISLYTSRVVLQVLGVDDFGIYNIVGGVVVMFSFINNFLNGACQRFLNVAIARDGHIEAQKVFNTALFTHFVIALLFAVASETIGLWFVYTKLNLPLERFDAAIWLYHIYVLQTCISIFKVPYNAAIIAEEKMDFYAYTSIAESVLRLITVYLLVIIAFDKLIIYGLLHLAVAFLMILWYKHYCERHFNFCGFSLKYEKKYLRSMVSFSGWNLFGSIADLGYKQGTNIILNLFCGVALNAAMGLATTVRSTLFNFINNLQTAANPQIVKSYAIGDYTNYGKLIYRISKFSYYLMLFFAIPAFINMNYVLQLWLKDVPPHTEAFVLLGLIYCLIDSLHGPLWTSMQSTGNIRNYQLCASFALLLNLPLSYLALSCGYAPESILVVQIAVSVFVLIIRLIFSRYYAKLSFRSYLFDVIFPIACVTAISVPLPVLASIYFVQPIVRLILTSLIAILCVLLAAYFVGLSKSEQRTIGDLIRKKLFHK